MAPIGCMHTPFSSNPFLYIELTVTYSKCISTKIVYAPYIHMNSKSYKHNKHKQHINIKSSRIKHPKNKEHMERSQKGSVNCHNGLQ